MFVKAPTNIETLDLGFCRNRVDADNVVMVSMMVSMTMVSMTMTTMMVSMTTMMTTTSLLEYPLLAISKRFGIFGMEDFPVIHRVVSQNFRHYFSLQLGYWKIDGEQRIPRFADPFPVCVLRHHWWSIVIETQHDILRNTPVACSSSSSSSS